jgi:hypothetical protein
VLAMYPVRIRVLQVLGGHLEQGCAGTGGWGVSQLLLDLGQPLGAVRRAPHPVALAGLGVGSLGGGSAGFFCADLSSRVPARRSFAGQGWPGHVRRCTGARPAQIRSRLSSHRRPDCSHQDLGWLDEVWRRVSPGLEW